MLPSAQSHRARQFSTIDEKHRGHIRIAKVSAVPQVPRLNLTRLSTLRAEELLTAEARAVSATRSAQDEVAGPLVVGTWGSTAAILLAPIVARMSA